MKSIWVAAVVILSACSATAAELPSDSALKNATDLMTTFAHGGGGGGGASGGGHGGGGGGGGGHSSAAPGGRGYSPGYHGARGTMASGYRPGMTAGRYPVYGHRAIRANDGTSISHHRNVAGNGTSHHRVTSQTGVTHHAVKGQTSSTRANRTGVKNRSSATSNDRTFSQKPGGGSRADLTTLGAKGRRSAWARQNPKNKTRFDQQTQNKLRNWQGHTSSLAEARQRHHQDGHHHGHDWWHHHCHPIIIVDGGFWGWWDGWWYPAWGYDPSYDYYPYDGPIYGYDGLPPDEAVANVQTELQKRGYYPYTVDGIFGRGTEGALRRYQGHQGLPVTGEIDPETVKSLGLD
jgi:hypothetical protein